MIQRLVKQDDDPFKLGKTPSTELAKVDPAKANAADEIVGLP